MFQLFHMILIFLLITILRSQTIKLVTKQLDFLGTIKPVFLASILYINFISDV